MQTDFDVYYTITLEDHVLSFNGVFTVYNTDKIETGNGFYKFVENYEDAEKFVEDIYANQGEETLVDIPDWIYETPEGIGNTRIDFD